MKATIIKYLKNRKARADAEHVAHNESTIERTTSRVGSIHESMYSNRVGFLQRAVRRVGFGDKAPKITQNELKRLGSIQTQQAGITLSSGKGRR